jgi:hyperosmotically inducible periplasmic protein
MNRKLVIICTLLASAACERSERQEQETSPSLLPPPVIDQGTPRTEPSQLEPGINAPAITAEERLNMSGKDEPAAGAEHGAKSQSSTDRAITLRVREAINADDMLSGSAKNLSVVTSDGVVTLRGPVQSSQEKSRVSETVKRIEGVKSIDDQLQISGD